MKNTGINRINGRVYSPIIVINRLPKAPFKEMLWVRDFTSKR